MRENGDMSLLKVVVLAIIQGLAELLPVSSSAHVVVAERLMGLDVSSPAMTLLLVMLHTGTMFAVIVYFWKQWKAAYFSSAEAFRHIALRLLAATTLTGIVGYGVMKLIEKTILGNLPHAQIEDLFGHLEWIAPALAAAGVLIIVAGVRGPKDLRPEPQIEGGRQLSLPQAVWVGAVQGLSLPFRGFSRSGATISTGMLTGVTKVRAETFSFALAVILTPGAIVREALRVVQHERAIALPEPSHPFAGVFLPGLAGMLCSFLAGVIGLKWLSSWLETDRWYLFGIYCLIASLVVFVLHRAGY
jgi:undecaprenyl-diphosphatase